MYSVLIVDDEKLIKKSIKVLIESYATQFNVIGEAKNGKEGLALNRRLTPDLIITDIRIPKVDGLKFIQEAKSHDQSTKFMIVSGYDEFEYAQQALRFGVVDFLLKPIKPDQFLESLRKVYRQLESEKNEPKKRSEWLWTLKSYAEQLAEQIWQLDENKMIQICKNLHMEVSEKNEDSQVIHSLYKDLLAYLQGEMNDKTNSAGSDLNFSVEPLSFPSEHDRIQEKMIDICLNVMGKIKENRNFGHRNRILQAVQYVQNHFADKELSLQKMADMVQMSPSYFSVEFKKEMGTNFSQYLTETRIEKAKSLLNDPLCKTYEIAYAVGYKDYPHFTKTFKKRTGLTPSEYRKRMGVS